MMYNPQLETFICVADTGSFSKAAEQLYISAPAVIKQINSLEDSLKLYYDYVATTEQEIYALYKGNPDNWEIHCFSQTGDFLKRMILKEKIISFDVSESFMYGLTINEEIYKYKI